MELYKEVIFRIKGGSTLIEKKSKEIGRTAAETPRILSVHELTLYLKGLLERDTRLQNVWVRGEISNFKLHTPSGHMYFTLKDGFSCVKVVMFRSRAVLVPFRPEQGMRVILRGYIGLYERDGQYQIYCEEMQPDGLGSLHLALEQLKARLSGEGLFDSERKKKLPLLPNTIGVATSLTGAAIQDVLKVVFRRFPNMRVVVAPCAVQGEAAPGEIAKAIKLLNQATGIDVIIVGRGGGSREELWAFNAEEVVRAIAGSCVPVISAVGHETDITLADLAADLRAPTPSAAAELAVPQKVDLLGTVKDLSMRLNSAVQNQVSAKRRVSEMLASSPALTNPFYRLNQEQQRLDQLRTDLGQSIGGFLREKNVILTLLAEKLDVLSPLKVLARGYSICQKEDGQTVMDASQVSFGETVSLTLAKGKLNCKVEEVSPCHKR